MPRPPIKEAHQAATKALVVKYNDEWQQLVNEKLAAMGWAQEERTVKKWVTTAAKAE